MLGLFETVLKGILHARWSVGVFTPMSPLEAMRARKTPKSPALEIIIQRVQAILSSVSNQAEWEAAFIEGDTPLCRDADSAKRLAKDIAGIPATATKMARALFQSWLKQGRVALLEHANYPCLGVLQRLERHRATMTSVLIEPELVTACLRADLVALQRTLQNKQLDHQAKKLSKSPIQLWDESLCHQPPESKQRTLYQSRMVPELCARILPELQAQRGCDGDYAAQLFNYFLRGGIDGLLIWHCGEVALEIRKRQMVQLFQQ